MPNIIKLKGSEFTAPTSLGDANTAVGNTTLEAGSHYIQNTPSDKIYASAGKFTPVAFTN
mgnify:CR=1 FL=1